MAPKLRFSDGEKVLCFHGPLLYEAKCIKSQVKEKNVKYFIHYSGWNKNWDEWVPESRVLKYNDANIQKQKELEAAHGRLSLQDGNVETPQGKKRSHGSSVRALKSSGVKKGKKGKTGKNTSKKEPSDRESSALPPQEKTPKQKGKDVVVTPTPPVENQQVELQRKKRTRAEMNVETEEEYVTKLEIKIKIPDELKHWLVDDWDFINRHKKLLQLPARVPVDTILSEYIKHKSVKGLTPNKEAALLETVNGIKEYFNTMLGKQLLYKFERPQHNELMTENPDAMPSQLYGAMHLLRLFSKIGGAIAYTSLDEDSVNVVSSYLYDFIKYISKSTTTPLLSIGDYAPASPEYLKKAC